ncbi:hypothetical protein QEG73_15250 [Chitinophagaceae bacterium 26-R-25]|nr:hypothetical protein [Chitinophagaceae bacterium 26-R-25]
MNNKFLSVVLGLVVLSSCSVYKQGQTPDDTYYSPAPPAQQGEAYTTAHAGNNGNNDNYRDYYSGNNSSYDSYNNSDYYNDRFLRLSIGNPMYYSAYSNYYWNSMSYGYGFGMGAGIYNPWNSYYYWNSFYNPYAMPYYSPYCSYYPVGGYYPGKYPVAGATYTRPAFNTSSYLGSSYSNSNKYLNPRSSSSYLNNGYNNANAVRPSSSRGSSYYTPNSSSYNNSNRSTNSTSSRSYNNTNTYDNSNSRPQRTYTPPSYTPAPSSSGGSYRGGGGGGTSGGGGGGGYSRPSRGH